MDEFGSLLGMKNSLFRRVGNFLTGPAESLPFCGLLDSESEAGIANSLYFPCIIPSPLDQNRCAQSRNPIDMIVQGWSTRLFQAKQQCSRMSGLVEDEQSVTTRRHCQRDLGQMQVHRRDVAAGQD